MWFIVALLVCANAEEKLKSGLSLGDMFLGGAVLQRNTHVAVWGTSKQANVDVSLDDALTIRVPVNSSSIWYTHLPPQPAAWNRTLEVKDSTGAQKALVSFGETILCVGQSNMGMQVGPSKRGFDADNATAEAAASVRYSGKISLHSRESRWPAARGTSVIWPLQSTTWYSVTPDSIPTFSAVCWLTGRNLFDHLGGKIPVGLAMNAIGAHSIEGWLSPEAAKACGVTTPCTSKQPIGFIWGKTITPMQPFTFGSMIFDQGEQNMQCSDPNREAQYPCLQAELVKFYRASFNSSFPFIAVQLPGYKDGVFDFRLLQEKGAAMVDNAVVMPSYDDSCAMDQHHGCPHGNVHNVHKQIVGERLALLLRKMKLGEQIVAQGPRIKSVTVAQNFTNGPFRVQFNFDAGHLSLKGTRNCTSCCGGNSSDFDFSTDRRNWFDGQRAYLQQGSSVEVTVRMPQAPKFARYTANKVFPQCAVYNDAGLPAFPFIENVSMEKMTFV